MKPVGIFGNHLSECPDIKRKGTPISIHRVPHGQSNKVKTYFSSVGSPCSTYQILYWGKMKILFLDYVEECLLFPIKTTLNIETFPF